MRRTISVMVGKGSVNHNRRKFIAENVNADRTFNNIEYCYTPIKKVYHELFDESLRRYNDKQTRSDRRIDDYYEKIRSGKQEKPFHEIIIQVGSCDDMSATGENAELAKSVLDEYYSGFRQRNPCLNVFSAHLHMDEGTPHLHIDFIPFTTGSKRGLDTRVSLKQALAKQGFTGKGKGATEWAMWVLSEKEQLAQAMQRHGIEWEQKGTHDRHLSVLDYKKQERAKEVAKLETKLIDKKNEFEVLQTRIRNFDKGIQMLADLKQEMETDEEYQLPDPPTLMPVKTYKQRFVDPLIRKLKSLVITAFTRYHQALDSYHRLSTTNDRLYRENQNLRNARERLKAENEDLRSESKDFRLLRKVFGRQQIDSLIAQAKEQQRKQLSKNKQYER